MSPSFIELDLKEGTDPRLPKFKTQFATYFLKLICYSYIPETCPKGAIKPPFTSETMIKMKEVNRNRQAINFRLPLISAVNEKFEEESPVPELEKDGIVTYLFE